MMRRDWVGLLRRGGIVSLLRAKLVSECHLKFIPSALAAARKR